MNGCRGSECNVATARADGCGEGGASEGVKVSWGRPVGVRSKSEVVQATQRICRTGRRVFRTRDLPESASVCPACKRRCVEGTTRQDRVEARA